MGDKTRGLYPEGKFDVRRKDGSSLPGGKHEDCHYFVLDLTHDPFAIPAIRAYATACRAEYPLLARDLENKLAAMGDAALGSAPPPEDIPAQPQEGPQ